MQTQTRVKEICPTTTQEYIQRGALLVDVRKKSEVDQLSFDVPQVIHIPLAEFEERYGELPTDKMIVTVCNRGEQSLRAAGFLQNKGYENVVNMKQGLKKWVAKGFPTKGDVSAVEDAGGCCSSPDCC